MSAPKMATREGMKRIIRQDATVEAAVTLLATARYADRNVNEIDHPSVRERAIDSVIEALEGFDHLPWGELYREPEPEPVPGLTLADASVKDLVALAEKLGAAVRFVYTKPGEGPDDEADVRERLVVPYQGEVHDWGFRGACEDAQWAPRSWRWERVSHVQLERAPDAYLGLVGPDGKVRH